MRKLLFPLLALLVMDNTVTAQHTHTRAGHPERTSWFAQPANTPSYNGYYVGGGGGILKRDGRGSEEGTWGWDYTGSHGLRHRVALLWNHGRRSQGGTGAYKTDGPHVPDVIGGSIAATHELKKKRE